ncbi:DUF3347 domain-containing protein [Candidatus Poribacteria bacterium]|nr:DUF3347 domain-containing protein [Candidatus Poribacteria bacterium]
MWRTKVLVAGLIVCLGATLPVTAWAMDCGGGHSGSQGSHQGAQATHEHGTQSQAQGTEAGHEHGAVTSNEHTAADSIFDNYFDIRASLAQDTLKDVSSSANALAKAAGDSRATGSAGTNEAQEKTQRSLETEMAAAARDLAKKTDIASARTEFGELSSQLYEYRKATGMTSDNVHAFACDMAKKVWLQESADPGNPYYGRSMAKCAREIE